MLGIGKGLTRGNTLRSIVKRKLQAWYKADKTQAPLGEEEVANGNFSVGPELVSNGDFSNGITGWSVLANSSTPAQTTLINKGGYLRLPNATTGSDTDWRAKMATQDLAWESGKTYQVKFKIRANYSRDDIHVRTLHGSSDEENQVGTFSVTTDWVEHTFYHTADSSASTISFGDSAWHENENTEYIEIDDVSIKQTNPNDNWTVGTGWVIKDGSAEYTDGSGAGNIKQLGILTQNKKYRVSFEVLNNTARLGLFTNGGSGTIIDYASYNVGSHVLEFVGPATADLMFVTDDGGSSDFALANITLKEITNSVKDFSPNTNNGVLHSGKCLHFDQANNYIDINYWASKTIDANTKATFATWVNPDDVAPGDYIFGAWTVVTTALFYLGTKSGKLDLGWGNSGWTDTSLASGTLPVLANHTWYRVVAVVDGLTCKVYLNGEFVFSKTNASSFVINSEGISIGAQGDDHGDHFYGELADFQIYDKAWTASDVTYDYNNPDKDVFDDEGRSEVVSDVELVSSWTNSDFDSFISSGSNITQMVSGANGDNCYSNSLTVTSGKTYKVEFTSSQSVSNCQVRAAANADMSTADIISSSVSEGLNTFTFIAGDNRAYIGFRATGLFTDTQITNFSVKEVTTQAGEISPTDCTALYRLNEGAGDRVYNAAPVLSAEKLSNTDFTTDSVWSEYLGADINTTVSNALYLPDGGSYVTQPSVIESGKIYKYTVTAKSETSTLSDLRLQTGSIIQKTIEDVPTSYTTYTGVITSTSSNFTVAEGGGGVLIVDSISLKEISLSNSYVQASWDASNWITAQPYIPQYAMSSYSKKMLFDGSDNLVDCGEGTAIDNIFDGGGSWSAWFSAETDGESNAGTMLSKEKVRIKTTADSGGDVTMQFLHLFDGTDGIWEAPTDAVLLNKINHIVVTYDNSSDSNNPVIYINGVSVTVSEVDTGPSGTRESDASYELTVGAQNDAGAKAYDGFIDEVSVWDRELTATEAQEIFNSGMALDCRDHSAYYGGEVLSNGDFSSPGVLSAGHQNLGFVEDNALASISNGELSITATSLIGQVYATLGNSSLSILETNAFYKFTYTITEVSGSLSMDFFGDDGTWKNLTSDQMTVGTHTITFKAPGASFAVRQKTDGSTVKFSSWSVKKIQLNGYWRNNGLDDWTDLSPYGNDGDAQNAVAADVIQLQEVPYFKKDTFGLPMNKVRERALNLDGDSYVEIADDNSLDFGAANGSGGAFSIDGWARFTGSTSRGMIFASGGNPIGAESGSFAIFTKIDAGNRRLEFIVNGEAIDANINSKVADGDWFHFAATRDTSGGLELYVDSESFGNLSATSNSSATVDTGSVRYIGRDSGTTRYYKNLIDDIRLYDRELLAAEVAKNFKATKSKHKNNIVSNWSDDFSSSFI